MKEFQKAMAVFTRRTLILREGIRAGDYLDLDEDRVVKITEVQFLH